VGQLRQTWPARWQRVSVMRMAVGLWPSGTTRFKLRAGIEAVTFMLQALLQI